MSRGVDRATAAKPSVNDEMRSSLDDEQVWPWGQVMTKSRFDGEFDVVVAGAGSAGCVVSGRLTENPNITLCVIEAGKRDRNPWIHIPKGIGKLIPNPKVNWGYETEPEPGLSGRSVEW